MKIKILLLLLAIVAGCNTPGTIEYLSSDPNSNIEIYRYNYSSTGWVYVTRFKDKPNVQTVNWQERRGKTNVTQTNVVIYENDSIQVIKK